MIGSGNSCAIESAVLVVIAINRTAWKFQNEGISGPQRETPCLPQNA